MKKSLAFVFLLSVLTSITVQAQTYSLKAGYSNTNINVSLLPISIFSSRSGINAGLVINDLQLGDNLGIQPEILYAQQGAKVLGQDVALHYLQVPVLAKLRLSDQLGLLVGPQVGYLVNASIANAIAYTGLFQKLDVSGVAGLEYQVNENVSLGGRYQYGFNDISKDFKITQGISFNDFFQMRNVGFQIYAAYRFGQK
jgi:Outer membrane protein beta-barrel domain